jgi:tetratricopeptide (TPR) repeat protein
MLPEIKEEFDKISQAGPKAIIEFYQKHKEFLGQTSRFNNETDYLTALRIKIAYIDALQDIKHFPKVISVGRKMLTELNSVEKKINLGQGREAVMLFLGIAYSKQGNFKQSNYYFKELVEIDASNEKYSAWFSANIKWLHKRTFNRVWNVLTIALITSFLLEFVSDILVFKYLTYTLAAMVIVLWIGGKRIRQVFQPKT